MSKGLADLQSELHERCREFQMLMHEIRGLQTAIKTTAAAEGYDAGKHQRRRLTMSRLKDLLEAYNNHKAVIDELDQRGLYKKVDDVPCVFKKVGRIDGGLWTAGQVQSFHQDKIGDLLTTIMKYMPCNQDRFCDYCPIEEDCVGEIS